MTVPSPQHGKDLLAPLVGIAHSDPVVAQMLVKLRIESRSPESALDKRSEGGLYQVRVGAIGNLLHIEMVPLDGPSEGPQPRRQHSLQIVHGVIVPRLDPPHIPC